MKVLMAPVNIAGQPITLVNELIKQGVDISLYQYTLGSPHRFGYQSGTTFNLSGKNRRVAEIEVLKKSIELNFDIFHFWMATFFSSPKYQALYGLDLPFLKVRNKKIIYRSTGYDVRTRTEDIKFNPYSPFRYGYENNIDETKQNIYLEYLKDYVDLFICQDPEMAQFLPGAYIVPRSIDLSLWPYIGVSNTDRPLVIHAPSSKIVKGTKFILKAVDELQDEGIKFDFKLVHGLEQENAIEVYKKADICIDQILIGWFGVFAIECMALGKPVIAYVRDDLKGKELSHIPVINANPDNIKSALKKIIKDKEKRFELSKLSRNYIEKNHDVAVVARKLKKIYETIYRKEAKVPDCCYDLDYLSNYFNFKSFKKPQNYEKLIRDNEYFKERIKSLRENVNRLKIFIDKQNKQRQYYKKNLLYYQKLISFLKKFDFRDKY